MYTQTPLKISLETRTDDPSSIQPFHVTFPSSEHEQLHFDLQHKGYALLQLPDVAVEIIEQLRECSKAFFSEDASVKERYFDAAHDAGYMASRGVKETFQIRHARDFHAWPSPALAELSLRAYHLFDALARACLAALVEQHLRATDLHGAEHVTGDLAADHVSDPAAVLAHVLDPPHAAWTSSCLNVFHYTRAHSTGCVPHTDGGLLTLIPGTAESGLEVYSGLTRDWRAGPRDRSICLVLLGDTVARLTGDTLTATCHRVLTEQPRVSTVFKQRAKLTLTGARSDAEARVLANLLAQHSD